MQKVIDTLTSRIEDITLAYNRYKEEESKAETEVRRTVLNSCAASIWDVISELKNLRAEFQREATSKTAGYTICKIKAYDRAWLSNSGEITINDKSGNEVTFEIKPEDGGTAMEMIQRLMDRTDRFWACEMSEPIPVKESDIP